jgi:predicted DCC family thiol-disulfide oxidoreductase YuxK
MITVFYDGKCGLCSREIIYYKRIAPEGVFEWIDIVKMPAEFEKRGFEVKAGLKALHVEDDLGVMHKGVSAFIVIWRKLPRFWPYIAFLIGLPIVLPLSKKIYGLFAAWRFKKLRYDQCQL